MNCISSAVHPQIYDLAGKSTGGETEQAEKCALAPETYSHSSAPLYAESLSSTTCPKLPLCACMPIREHRQSEKTRVGVIVDCAPERYVKARSQLKHERKSRTTCTAPPLGLRHGIHVRRNSYGTATCKVLYVPWHLKVVPLRSNRNDIETESAPASCFE